MALGIGANRPGCSATYRAEPRRNPVSARPPLYTKLFYG
jgi:hypothetical protein